MGLQVVVHEPQSVLTVKLEQSFSQDQAIRFRWAPHFIDLQIHARDPETVLLISHQMDLTSELLREFAALSESLSIVCALNEHDLPHEELLRELGVVSVMDENLATQVLLPTVRKILKHTRTQID